LLKLEIFWPY